MDRTTAEDLRDRLDALKTVDSARVFYVDGERVYETHRDYTPEEHDEFEVEVIGSTGGVIQPDILVRLAEEEVGIAHSLVDPGTIRTRSTGLTTHIMDL